MSLARQVLWLQMLLVVVLIAPLSVLAVLQAQDQADDRTRAVVSGIAVSIAKDPNVVALVESPDPEAELQPYASAVEEVTGVDFVVIMAPDRTRFTHPTKAERGGKYIGSIKQALLGKSQTEEFTGTLGSSIRTIVPIEDAQGDVVGMVSVGRTRERIGGQVRDQLPWIGAVMAGGLVIGVAGAWLVSRRLSRQTAGLGARDLRAMYDHHDAVLHSIREGLVVFDSDDSIALVNDEARRLLDLGDGPVTSTDLPVSLRQPSQVPVTDEVHVTDSRVLVVNQQPVDSRDGPRGQVVTIRDRTELEAMLGELDSVRSFAESLRSQAHEASNRLHTIITMIEMGRAEDAVEFATEELDLSQSLIDRLVRDIDEPALSALLLGKSSSADERGVRLVITEDSELDSVDPLSSQEAITIVGNLIDNALDAVGSGPGAMVTVTARRDEEGLLIRVEDSGPGISEDDPARVFERGYSTKGSQRGLGMALVVQAVRRHDGTVEVERNPSVVAVRIPAKEQA